MSVQHFAGQSCQNEKQHRQSELKVVGGCGARKSICTTFCFEIFFCLGVRRPKKIGQIPQNCQKSIFVDQNQKKNSKQKVVHMLFLAQKNKF